MTDDADEFFSGSALDPFKVAPPGKCIWCGGAGLTSEHKFKRSDLQRVSDNEPLVWGNGAGINEVRSSTRSKSVRFKPNLCANCNNARSQPFDLAYDKFSAYVWRYADSMWRTRYLDMNLIYGKEWQTDVLNLARYFAKHIGCRMSDNGYEVPSVLVPFLDGGSYLSNVQMVLFKDRALYRLHREGKREGVDGRGLWIGPAYGQVSRRRQRLTAYSSTLCVGFVGVFYRWDLDYEATDPFYAYQRARLHKKHKLPTM